jgi:hypothetical protein
MYILLYSLPWVTTWLASFAWDDLSSSTIAWSVTSSNERPREVTLLLYVQQHRTHFCPMLSWTWAPCGKTGRWKSIDMDIWNKSVAKNDELT